MKIIRATLLIVGIVLAGFGLLTLLVGATTKEAKMRCFQFQQYAKDYPDFWITAQDKVECDGLNINVNADVR